MKPLAGYKIVEVGSVVLGPYASLILADMGADVVKVEPLQGDILRQAGIGKSQGMSAVFMGCNRGKKSLALNLKSEDGLAILHKLIADSDVFMHNMRAEAAQRMGLGYAELSKANPRLVYCGMYGFGAAGPYAQRPAYDDIIQAMSGIVQTRRRGDDSDPQYVPTVIADKTTALFAAIAIVSALLARGQAGKGQEVEVGMFESMVHFVSVEHMAGLTYAPPIGPAGYARVLAPDRRPYRTRDGGYLAVMPYNDADWDALFQAGGSDLIRSDARFVDMGSRASNADLLYAETAALMLKLPREEWIKVLKANDIPWAPLLSLDELQSDEHLNHIGFWHRVEHPTEGSIVVPSSPMRFGGPSSELTAAHIAPLLGEHTLEILQALGYDGDQQTELIRRSVVGVSQREKSQ